MHLSVFCDVLVYWLYLYVCVCSGGGGGGVACTGARVDAAHLFFTCVAPPSYSLWLEEMPFELELIGSGYQYALCLHLWANNLCMQVFLFTLLLGYALVFFCQCKIIFYVIIFVISLFVLTTLWLFFSSFSSSFWNLTIHLPLFYLCCPSILFFMVGRNVIRVRAHSLFVLPCLISLSLSDFPYDLIVFVSRAVSYNCKHIVLFHQ